jgi:hypothetical protein
MIEIQYTECAVVSAMVLIPTIITIWISTMLIKEEMFLWRKDKEADKNLFKHLKGNIKRKELLIETWLDPDPDDHITAHDLYVSALEAMEYIEELETENEALKKDQERDS